MNALLLRGLESTFAWILEASWQASVLAALVLLLQSVFRGKLNPRWHHALWLLVVARLLLPVLPESALSIFQFAPAPPPAVEQTMIEPIFTAPPVMPVLSTATTPAPPAPPYPFSAFTVLALFWLAGALGLLLTTWAVNRRFAGHVSSAPEVTDSRLLQLADAARQELGIRHAPRMIESAQVQSPAIMGLFRPTLILPTAVLERFTDKELRFIFLHEFAHLKRGDLFLQWLIALLQIMHWFNPALWYSFRRMRLDREPATDALVLSRTGEEQKNSYGQVLVKLLHHYRARHSLPTLVGILEDKDQFKRRFSLIARFTCGAYGWSLLGVLLIGVLSVACLTKGKASENAISPTQSAADKRHDQLYNDLRIENLKVRDMPLDQFIEKISKELGAQDPKKQGVNFVLRIPPGESPILVSLDFTKYPGYRANIGMILGPLKARYPIRYKFDDSLPGTIYINQLSKDEIAFDKKASSTLIDIDFSNTDPVMALKSVQAASTSKGFAFDLDLKSISQLDALKKLPVIDLKAIQVSVDQALRSIFYLADLHPMPLDHFTGYTIQPQAPEATKTLTYLEIGSQPKSFALGSGAERRMHESLQKYSGWSGPCLNGPAYQADGTQNGPGTISQKVPPPNGDLAQEFMIDPKIIDKVHIQVATTLEIKDLQGHSLGKATGNATLVSGQRAVLASSGLAAISLPGKGGAPGLGFVGIMQITLVNEDDQPLLPTPTPPGEEIPASLSSSSSPQSANVADSTNCAIIDAIKAGNTAKVAEFLQQGADSNAINGYGKSALQLALEGDHIEIAKTLLEKGADPNAPSSGWNLFTFARSAEAVRLLIQHGASFQSKLNDGDTLIESVASTGPGDNAAVINELINDGAPFEPKGDGVSALARAAARNQVPTMKMLIRHGVDPNAYSTDSRMQTTALHNAVGEPSSDAVKFLLERGVNPSGDPRDGSTPLAMAIEQGRPENEMLLRGAGAHDVSELAAAAAYGDVKKVTELLGKGVNVDDGDSAGVTPLQYAVRRGQIETARVLVAHGANINKFDSVGLSPYGELQFTAHFFEENPGLEELNWNVSPQEALVRLAALQRLFAKDSAGPDYRDADGRTVLHLMAIAGNPMITFFVSNKEHPVDPNSCDKDGNTPLLLAALSPRAGDLTPKISIIEDTKNPQKTKDWNAEAYVANRLIEAGAKVNLVVNGGKTVGELAMEAAAKANNSQLVSVLQEAGVKVPRDSSQPPASSSTGKTTGMTNQTGSPEVAQAAVPAAAEDKEFAKLPKGNIEIGLKVVEISDDVYLAHKTRIDAAVEKADIGFFNNMGGVSLLSTPSVSTQPGTKANIDIVREFPYPTEFEPGKVTPHAVLSVQGGGTTNVTLVVPPTPREFATKDIGVSAEITPTINGANSPDPGKIVLNGKFIVTDFEGFIKSNINNINMPSFETRESLFIEGLDNHQEKGIWIPGGRFDEQTIVDKDSQGKLISQKKESVKKRLLLFVSASLVK